MWVAAHGAEIPPILLGKYGPYDAWLTNAIREHGLPFVLGRHLCECARALRHVVGDVHRQRDIAEIAARCRSPSAATLIARDRRLALRASCAGDGVVPRGVHGARDRVAVRADPIRVGAVAAVLRDARARHRLDGRVASGRDATPRGPRCAALAACGLLLVGFGWYNVNGVRQQWRDSVPRVTAARATPVVEWVRAATRPTDIIAMEDDPLIYLYTGRRSGTGRHVHARGIPE